MYFPFDCTVMSRNKNAGSDLKFKGFIVYKAVTKADRFYACISVLFSGPVSSLHAVSIPRARPTQLTYSLHRHSRARPLCAYFHTFSMLRTRLLVFEFHAFSNVCNQTGRSTYMILPVWYYSSD